MIGGLAAHLPALIVAGPLLAAPLCLLLEGRARAAWALAFAAALASFAAAGVLLGQVWSGGIISYALGGFAPPLGIEYRVDAANALVLLVVTGAAALAMLFARESAAAEIPPRQQPWFYACALLCLSGLAGVAATGDAFNVFVFLEISSLSAYALIALGAARDRRALTAAYNYLILGTIGAGFYVIGIGFLYALTGTLNMADLAQRLDAVSDLRAARTGLAFIVAGLALKIALFPLHFWLPNAYSFAPSAAAVLLSAASTKVAVYVLARFLFSVFGAGFTFEIALLEQMLMPLALISIFAASLIAVFQENLKTMLAWSSIAQMGYIVLGFSFETRTGIEGGLLHLFNHALMKAALFMALGCVVFRTGAAAFGNMAGLARQMPWTMTAFAIAGLSLIGLPLTAGFISKWILIEAALEKNLWPVAGAIAGASLIAAVYILRVLEAAWFGAPAPRRGGSRVAGSKEAPLTMLIPLWLLALANLYFGIDPRLPFAAAETAAGLLLDPGGAPVRLLP